MENTPLQAAIIGAGNVAWGLAPALEKGGMVTIKRVIARSMESASALASALGHNVEASTDTRGADRDVDLVIVAATDSAVEPLARASAGSQAIWIHTSGSVDTTVLAAASPRYGVIYPMQTFTRGVATDLSDAPIFIDAASPELADLLTRIALTVSANVRPADSAARRRLHCAAVFACNFTNHLWDIADGLARRAGSSIADFMPLIDETLRKAKAIGPHAGQTGPARRGAEGVMELHRLMLSPADAEIYRLLSQSIAKAYEQD